MIIIHRQVQHIYPDKWAELEAIDKKFTAVESRFGFPPKKRYQCLTGTQEAKTLIVETQWPSLANMESTFERAMADPEYQALQNESVTIIKDLFWELYMPLP